MQRALAATGLVVVLLAGCGAGGAPGNYRKGACEAVEAGALSLEHLEAATAALDAGDAAGVAEQVELARVDAHVVGGQISYIPRNWDPGAETRALLTEEVHEPLDRARAMFPDPRAGATELPELSEDERRELDALMQRAGAGIATVRANLGDALGIDCSGA